jgi:RND family efflux transporter MFP subunit
MTTKSSRRWLPRLLVVVVLVSIIAAVIIKMTNNDDKAIDDALITKVKKGDLVLEVIDTGKIEPRDRVDIKSKVSGQVLEVLVDEGEVVAKGQLLLRLDPVDYARESARAEAELAQAKQAFAFAGQVLVRKQAALAERAVAQTEVEQAQNEVDMRQATVRIAEVAVGAARDRLRSCDVKSPLAGTIIQRGVEPGEVVTAGVQATVDGKPLLTVADLATLLVKTELNQIDVARVAIGQPVTVALDALPGVSFTAKLTKIAPAAVKAEARDAEVFPVEATLDGGSLGIKSGMTADVRILVATLPAVLLLPIEAVRKEEGNSQVQKIVVIDGKKKMEKTEVKVGRSNDREVEVLEGLTEGSEVVVDPASSKDNEANL